MKPLGYNYQARMKVFLRIFKEVCQTPLSCLTSSFKYSVLKLKAHIILLSKCSCISENYNLNIINFRS